MIKLEYVAQNIVENMISCKKDSIEDGSSIVITFEYNFMEFFKEPISKNKIQLLNKAFGNIKINKDYIEKDVYLSLLFIKRSGYYSCFILDDDSERLPMFLNESEWHFTTNHNSCWRTTAFEKANQVLTSAIHDIFEISKIQSLDLISVPKHIIPNFSDVSNSEVFKFDKIETDESYKKNIHVINKNKKMIKLRIKE